MESHFLLAVIIVFSFSCFGVTCSLYGTFLESALDIKVIGNSTARSGVRQYTVHGDSSKLEYIKCTAKNDTGNLKTVMILENDTPVNADNVENGYSPYMAFTDNVKGNGSWTYACRAMYEIIKGSFIAQYTVEMDVEVVAVNRTYLIASDVGCRVYKGEQISVSCDGFYKPKVFANDVNTSDYSYFEDNDNGTNSQWELICPVFLKGDISPTIHIPFDHAPINLTCDLHQFDLDPETSDSDRPTPPGCTKDISLLLNVASKLNVSLDPLTFDRVTKNLTFACTSDPPRLMYWTVLTTNNTKMIDIHEPPEISANITINITQKPGYSKIVILIDGDDENNDNGIETVTCSTYDTKAHVIKTAQRTLDDKYLSAISQKVGGVSITLIVLTVLVIVLVIVVILLFRRLHQIRALSLKSPAGSNDGDDKVPSETELQDNPAYLPYTGTDDVSP